MSPASRTDAAAAAGERGELRHGERETARRCDVAIVGMACVFPGAPDLATFAANLAAGVDATGAVPAGRWDPVFYDPAAGGSDRFYCRRGGFVDGVEVDPAALGVMPAVARAIEPDQLLALDVALRAVADSGLERRDVDRARVGVVVGRGNYAGAGRTRLVEHVRGAEQLVRALRQLVPGVSEAALAEVKAAYQKEVGAAGVDGAIGLVPNLTASRIANRLDLGGAAYTVDAACASSLVAIDQATAELRAGRLDAVIVGGVHVCQDEAFWSVFCQLGALSRREQIRPFDRRADGLLIGVGAGMVVLRRRADAERDGDRIYALIRGTGVASDGRASLLAPSVDGQVLAVERAWCDAGLDPKSVGLIEAHGTATPTGDAAEIETLQRVFAGATGAGGAGAGGGGGAVVGSVKSMIGHAMPAAGIAGLIKAALALHRRELLPTLHCEEPHPGLARAGLRTIGRVEPWHAGDGPRRAAVSAFGFGGIDAHVVLEEAVPPRAAGAIVTEIAAGAAAGLAGAAHAAHDVAARGPRLRARGTLPPLEILAPATAAATSAAAPRPVARTEASPTRIVALAAADPAALLAQLDALIAGAAIGSLGDGAPIRRAGEGSCRLALLDPTPERLAKARTVVAKGAAWRGRDNLWFAPRGLCADGGRVVFAFPGIDAAFQPRLVDVAAHFDWPLSEEATTGATSIEKIGVGLIDSGRLLDRALGALGIGADLVCGHSVGEWTAMITTGMLPDDRVEALVAQARTGSLEVPGVVFAALGCGVDKARAALDGLPDIAVSHDNCPHQVILCGVETSAAEALRRLRAAGVLGQLLPFRSGFHSPLFAPYLGMHRDNFATMPLLAPGRPLWSATTCAPYPAADAAVRSLAMQHLVEPVRFRELVDRLYGEGARLFIQVGPGSVVGFIGDTLRGKPHVAIAANVADRDGMDQLWRVAAAAWAEGLAPRFERLLPAGASAAATEAGAAAVAPAIPAPPAAAASPAKRRPGMTLALGVPLVELSLPPLALSDGRTASMLELSDSRTTAAAIGAAPTASLAAEMKDLFDEVGRAGTEILAALARPQPVAPPAAMAPIAMRPAAMAPIAMRPTAMPPAAMPPAPLGPRHRRVAVTFSVETHPWLLDHTFMRQPRGWSNVRDRHPVVPMTTTIQLMLDIAGRLVPERVAIGLESLRALRWLAVPQPTDVTVDARFDGVDRVAVTVEGYSQATVVLGPAYPAAPPHRPQPPANARRTEVSAAALYDQRWMFHGPAFQCVRDVGLVGDDGILGELESLPAPGALLDNAGQLLGFWVMVTEVKDRLAMPIAIERLVLHGPHPAPGVRVACEVEITTLDEKRVVADLVLSAAGQPWCTITGWEDRRFDTDPRFWGILMWPERNRLADPLDSSGDPDKTPGPDRDAIAIAASAPPDGPGADPVPLVFDDIYRAAPTREQLYRRYLGERERAVFDALAPRRQRPHLDGRIAAKDAVRDLLWRSGAGPLFPAEIEITAAPSGQPLVQPPASHAGRDLRVSIAHKGEVAVAIAAEGRAVGVDIETIAPRAPGFDSVAFDPAELTLLLPADDGDEWRTRMWSAKEAVGKLRGTGLGGAPRRFPITDRTGQRLLCDGVWVETRRRGDQVIAWCVADPSHLPAPRPGATSTGKDE